MMVNYCATFECKNEHHRRKEFGIGGGFFSFFLAFIGPLMIFYLAPACHADEKRREERTFFRFRCAHRKGTVQQSSDFRSKLCTAYTSVEQQQQWGVEGRLRVRKTMGKKPTSSSSRTKKRRKKEEDRRRFSVFFFFFFFWCYSVFMTSPLSSWTAKHTHTVPPLLSFIPHASSTRKKKTTKTSFSSCTTTSSITSGGGRRGGGGRL